MHRTRQSKASPIELNLHFKQLTTLVDRLLHVNSKIANGGGKKHLEGMVTFKNRVLQTWAMETISELYFKQLLY